MPKVFISYSSEDAQFVDQLVKDLQERAVDVWYAKYEIKVGDSIVTKINDGLSTTDWLLLVMSESAVKSRWVQMELSPAVVLTMQRGAYILVARIDSVAIPSILIDRKYADFSADYQKGLTDILAVVAPDVAHFPDATSQIAWGKMSTIFNGLLQVEWTDARARTAFLADILDSLKSTWHMSDEVYDLYIDACVQAGRLLHPIEFIKLIPTFDVDDPRMHAAFRFLLENAIRG